MSLGMGPLALAVLILAQPPVKGDKEFEVPAAFSKRVPDTLEDLKAIERHVQILTKKVMPAVVSIRIGGSSGSGVIIDKEGHVLTAGHVSGDPNRPCSIIFPDGKTVKGITLGANRQIDSGMVKITDKGEYPFLEMARSAPLKRGDWCLAIGHPGGFQKGRSPVVRVGRLLDVNPSLLRTDCTLVGGDSGGPLFDMHGKVIGIHSRIGNDIAANIHVPVDTYRDTFDKLAKAEIWGNNIFGGGKPQPTSGYLGLSLSADAESKICKVRVVANDSPAEKAGVLVNDVIAKVDGKAVSSVEEFRNYVNAKKPNDKIRLEVVRGDETLQKEVVLARQPNSGLPPGRPPGPPKKAA